MSCGLKGDRMREIVLIATDFAPSAALGMVAEELRKKGKIATLLSGKEEAILPASATIVLSGMAHSVKAAQAELESSS